jgi:hypothetical protein
MGGVYDRKGQQAGWVGLAAAPAAAKAAKPVVVLHAKGKAPRL